MLCGHYVLISCEDICNLATLHLLDLSVDLIICGKFKVKILQKQSTSCFFMATCLIIQSLYEMVGHLNLLILIHFKALCQKEAAARLHKYQTIRIYQQTSNAYCVRLWNTTVYDL